MTDPRLHLGLLVVLVLTLTSTLGCRTAPVAQPADSNTFVFLLGAADSHMLLPGVEVTLYGSCGQDRLLGVTDSFGELAVKKDVLSQAPAGVVVFCERASFCGAWAVEKLKVASYSEVYVELAPFAIR